MRARLRTFHSYAARRAFTIWVIVFTLTTMAAFWQLRRQSQEGVHAHRALCALKLDLEFRVAATTAYLKTHPHGIPGIPVSVIRSQLVNQQQTLRSLDELRCPDFVPLS